MQAVMETVYQNFAVDGDAEITIECNPGTVTEHKFEVYRKIGINRLSIGLQSAHNDELKILGRIHTYEQFLKTYDMARKHGFTNINIDLMSSLPGQTPDIFCDSLHRVLQLKPEHISAYSLIIEKVHLFMIFINLMQSGRRLACRRNLSRRRRRSTRPRR